MSRRSGLNAAGLHRATITAGVEAPPNLVKTVYQYRNERRSAEFIRTAARRGESASEPTKARLVEFLDKNPAQFMPEYRSLSVLYLDPQEVAKELSPSEENIRTEYEDRLSSLVGAGAQATGTDPAAGRRSREKSPRHADGRPEFCRHLGREGNQRQV